MEALALSSALCGDIDKSGEKKKNAF